MIARAWVGIIAVVVGLGSGWAVWAQQPPTREVLMKQKLEQAQKNLEGVTTDNLAQVKASALELKRISGEAAWKIDPSPEYVQHSAEFRAIAESLATHAEAGKGDAAALDYIRLTGSCIACHKYVRDAQITWIDVPDRRLAHAGR